MKKILSLFFAMIALISLTACASNSGKPRLSAGASHSVPFTVGSETPAWITNAIRFYPWSSGRKIRVSTGVSVKPTKNTNAGVGIDW